MNKQDKKLTSVNVEKKAHKQFKMLSLQENITFQKLVNISMSLYINDERFRKLINEQA